MKTLITIAVLFLTLAVSAGVQCPVHGDSGAYFTGRTTTIDGHLMYEYKCPYGGGHTFLVRQN